MPRPDKQSTRPLTAESYRLAIADIQRIAREVAAGADLVSSVYTEDSQAARSRLTRAIRDLAMHAKRLDDRHRSHELARGGPCVFQRHREHCECGKNCRCQCTLPAEVERRAKFAAEVEAIRREVASPVPASDSFTRADERPIAQSPWTAIEKLGPLSVKRVDWPEGTAGGEA